MSFRDISNEKFGRLTPIEYIPGTKYKEGIWICKCDCGNTTKATAGNIKSGKMKSCGCLRREMSANINHTHGMSNNRLYGIWTDMKSRCLNISRPSYKDYGGRGIAICTEWINDFNFFYRWAIKNGYKANLTLDRKENDGNYEPNNCRWVTPKQQANNTRNNKFYEIDGVRKTLSQWCDIYSANYQRTFYRLKGGNYTLIEALTQPINLNYSRRKTNVN